MGPFNRRLLQKVPKAIQAKTNMITVVIAVGPEKHHQQWLDEAIRSVREQTLSADKIEILLIDDMAEVLRGRWYDTKDTMMLPQIWRAPWRLGIPAAYNCGVALASNECVFMMGSDDRLLPRCLELCLASYESHGRRDYYYGVGVAYSDGREDQYIPCHAAMVTKGLWRNTGGFPPESAVGAPDAALLSIILGNDELAKPVCVNGQMPLYWYRVHDQTDTAGRGPWQGSILAVRDLLTKEWKSPTWNRYE